jgi:hypothetical protein
VAGLWERQWFARDNFGSRGSSCTLPERWVGVFGYFGLRD